VWGAIVNTARNMARLITTSLQRDKAEPALLLVVSFSWTLAQRLQMRRADEPVRSLLAAVSPDLSLRVTHAMNKPLECLVALGELVREGMLASEAASAATRLNTMAERSALETGIAEFMGHLGACERLCTCPVPVSSCWGCSCPFFEPLKYTQCSALTTHVVTSTTPCLSRTFTA
jgi:predicted membrane chloride channel (bestrophin family)